MIKHENVKTLPTGPNQRSKSNLFNCYSNLMRLTARTSANSSIKDFIRLLTLTLTVMKATNKFTPRKVYWDRSGRGFTLAEIDQCIFMAHVHGEYPSHWDGKDISRFNLVYLFPYTKQLN